MPTPQDRPQPRLPRSRAAAVVRPCLAALAVAGLACALAGPARAQAPAPEPLLPYTVTARDTLIGLNRTLFAEPGAWKEVSRVNQLPDSNRLQPGQVLLVPAHLLHSKPVPARLVGVFGDVRVAERPAVAGMDVNVGEPIRTGPGSTAIVALADGSRIKLTPESEGRLDEHRRFQVQATAAAIDDGLVAATLRLLSGSVEVIATKVLRAKPLEVGTPAAVIGVRGTAYRVRSEHLPGGADASATEVLEGKVHAQAGADPALSADVPANFGAALQKDRTPRVLPLPAAPDLSSLPAEFDALPLRWHRPAGPPLRVQVADDAAFDHLLVDLHVAAGEDLVIPRLADGTWHVRARQVGDEGLEGLDAERTIAMHARPDAPSPTAPPSGTKQAVGDVTLRWDAGPGAARYAIEVARDAAFSQVALHVDDLAAGELVFHPVGTDFGAADGVYFWRVQGVDAAGHRSAWSESQAFVLRAAPRTALAQASPDGTAIELRWAGSTGDLVQAELARDPTFRDVVARADFPADRPGRLKRPAAGTWYVRYRFVEPDGFTTGWSDAARVQVAPGGGWFATLGR